MAGGLSDERIGLRTRWLLETLKASTVHVSIFPRAEFEASTNDAEHVQPASRHVQHDLQANYYLHLEFQER